jgi:hypothetical protein
VEVEFEVGEQGRKTVRVFDDLGCAAVPLQAQAVTVGLARHASGEEAMRMPLLHWDRPAVDQHLGAFGLGQERSDLPTGFLRPVALDEVRPEDAKGIPVITADDRFDFRIRHEGYYGKE